MSQAVRHSSPVELTVRRSRLLTPRQRECLILAQQGLTSIRIADRLGLSEHTVNGYLSDAYRRLGVRNRTHAVAVAVRLGEIPPAV